MAGDGSSGPGEYAGEQVDANGTVEGTYGSLIEGTLQGDQRSLSRLITRIENRAPGYDSAMGALYENSRTARTIGITGPPGAGKSTLVDKLVERYRERGLSVGVIAVDPSSPYSGGSVLGDRVRQTSRAADPEVFFRSMSARGASGGLAAATFDVIRAMDAFGKDVILIETVGAGQSEVEIVKIADTVCVVAIPGAGDDVQANKAGILEIANVFAVNKADLDDATVAAMELQQMVRIGEELEGETSEWVPPVEMTVAVSGEGVEELVGSLDDHYRHLESAGRLDEKRAARFRQEVGTHVRREMDAVLEAAVSGKVEGLWAGDVDPHAAADEILRPFRRAADGCPGTTDDG